jgi:ATPase subunit of ABC transporter with duplicated ATPase domains
MISFSNINKQYGKQLLFVDASFQLNPGEKVGLVGPNGAGKTTLFRMVVGEETPDEGGVSVPKKLTIGYFRQDVEECRAVPSWMKRSQAADASAISTTSSKPCSGKCPTLTRLMTCPRRYAARSVELLSPQALRSKSSKLRN